MLLLPMVVGYVVGAVGMYSLLSRTAPVVQEDPSYRPMPYPASEGTAEIIQLFGPAEVSKAA